MKIRTNNQSKVCPLVMGYVSVRVSTAKSLTACPLTRLQPALCVYNCTGRQPILVLFTDIVLLIYVIQLCFQRIFSDQYPCALNLWTGFLGTIMYVHCTDSLTADCRLPTAHHIFVRVGCVTDDLLAVLWPGLVLIVQSVQFLFVALLGTVFPVPIDSGKTE